MTADPVAADGPPPAPTLWQLFTAFGGIALAGFGGVLPWARRMLVERRRWLTGTEFTDVLGLCQFLPGPNVINVSIAVGARFHGVRGALAAFLGLVSGPVALMMIFGALYQRYGAVGPIQGAFAGVAAAAAGLVVAMAGRMALPVMRARPRHAVPFALAAFVAIGLLRWPMAWVLLVLATASIAAAWIWRR
ncbi:MAG: chromate transporter [Alphaproteobacteria bacterium]